ncbi:hypothetical protein LFL97_14175 [Burkholderia sp. JSH-S8]|nr:hypothetical protein LFL97_14175 [Burkholderia sp. JSH-S8]
MAHAESRVFCFIADTSEPDSESGRPARSRARMWGGIHRVYAQRPRAESPAAAVIGCAGKVAAARVTDVQRRAGHAPALRENTADVSPSCRVHRLELRNVLVYFFIQGIAHSRIHARPIR